MDKIEKGQLNQSAAEVYDTFFVPALFATWPEYVAKAAQIQPRQKVLDVACGTGVLACKIAEKTGAPRNITGLDINPQMLSVAQQKSPLIDWKQGAAENLPFDDNIFDAVVCQFGLMFFADQFKAINEMVRVLRPNQHLAIVVWASLEDTPGYWKLTGLLNELFGPEVANSIRVPYNLGDKEHLSTLFNHPNLTNIKIDTPINTANFPSLEAWLFTEIKGWVLADVLSDAQFDILLNEAQTKLKEFVKDDGAVRFDVPAHIVSATKIG